MRFFLLLVALICFTGVEIDAQCNARVGIQAGPRTQAAANGARCANPATDPVAAPRRCAAHEAICNGRHQNYHTQCNLPRGCTPPTLIDRRHVCTTANWPALLAAGVNPPGPMPVWAGGDCLRYLNYVAAQWTAYSNGIAAKIAAGELCLEMRQKWDHDCDPAGASAAQHGPEKAAVTAALVTCRAEALTAPGIAAGHTAAAAAAAAGPGGGIAPLVLIQHHFAHARKHKTQHHNDALEQLYV